MNTAELRALRLRFSGSYTNGKLLLHRLPNGLIAVTLDSSLASRLSQISEPPDLRTELKPGDPICTVNGESISLPFSCIVVDRNSDVMGSIERFKAGPTATFIVLVRQPPKTPFEVPNGFTPL